MKTILLQGDSITDAGRSREDDNRRGLGYPNLVAGEVLLDYPGQFKVINRGISGNRIVDLYARIKADFINLKPDYLTILIGINDVWHEVGGRGNGVADDKFRRVYSMLIEEILEACPGIKIYILEPFVLPGRATNECWDEFSAETPLRAKSAKAVAEKYGLTFIPLQEKFNELCKLAPADYWLEDGVHPTVAGHEAIAREVMNALKKDIG